MSSAFRAADVRFHYRTSGGYVAQWDNIVVQYQNGELEPEVFDAVERASRSFSDGREVAAIAVLDGSASIPSAAMRTKQRAVIRDLMKRLDGRIGLVVRGEDVWTQLLKSAVRLVIVGTPRVKMWSSVEEAIMWLAPVGDTQVDDLLAFWSFLQESRVEPGARTRSNS